MSIVRAKPGTATVVFNPDGTSTPVVANMAFDSDDPVVKAHPELFQVDAKVDAAPARVMSARVEDASAVPGRPRNR